MDQRTVPRPLEPAAGVVQDDGLVERLWGILRRRKSIVALALVLVPAAVLAYTLTQQPTYTAGATAPPADLEAAWLNGLPISKRSMNAACLCYGRHSRRAGKLAGQPTKRMPARPFK